MRSEVNEERVKPEKMSKAVEILLSALESAMKHNSQSQLALLSGLVEAAVLLDDGSREAGIAISGMDQRLSELKKAMA